MGPYKEWLAVSVAILQIAQGRPSAIMGYLPDEAYEWLRGKVPVAKIGYSILVYGLRHIQLPWPHARNAGSVGTLACRHSAEETMVLYLA